MNETYQFILALLTALSPVLLALIALLQVVILRQNQETNATTKDTNTTVKETHEMVNSTATALVQKNREDLAEVKGARDKALAEVERLTQ